MTVAGRPPRAAIVGIELYGGPYDGRRLPMSGEMPEELTLVWPPPMPYGPPGGPRVCIYAREKGTPYYRYRGPL